MTVGQVVYLKSGSCKMTINSLSGTTPVLAGLIWFNPLTGLIAYGSYYVESLTTTPTNV